MFFLAAFMWILDCKKMQAYAKFAIIFGANSIFAYVLHSALGMLFYLPIISGKGIQMSGMDVGRSTGFNRKVFSLVWSLCYTFFIYLIVREMYKRKIFIKI